MSQRDDKQFFALYQKYRYEDQLGFYKSRQEEFTTAQTQVIVISIVLIFLAGVAGVLQSAFDIPWVKLVFLLSAAICPVLSTAFAGYSTLYAFEQQAKLYKDTLNSLDAARRLAPDIKPGLSDAEYEKQLDEYVKAVEKIFEVEQGQWGQLAERMKPSEA